MVTTKTKPNGWMLRLLSALFLISGLTACDSTEDTIENEPNKPKPETPVADGDWQTVPATGGTITKDSISIIFPSGTFSEDTKVAISEVKASDVVGEEARSKFYQVVLPAIGTLKPFTIKLKCEGTTDDIDMIARMPGWNTETGVSALNNFHLKSSASGDYVSTTIPLMRSDGQEKPFFTIGLADGGIASGNETRGTTTSTSNPYKYRLRWNSLGLKLKYRILTLDKSIENLFYVNLPKAVKGLQDLNFEFPKEEIPFVFREIKGETWGNWITSKWSSIGEIELNVGYFSQLAQDITNTNLAKELQKTLVHESTHALQSMVYDPRWVYPLKNLNENLGEDWSSASEAIGSWSEKIIDGEHIGHNSTNKEGTDNVREFMKGFFPRYWTGTIYNHHGYGMGVFIEYLASKAGKNKIVELYNSQKEGKTFMDALKDFLSTHKISFFTAKDYYKFAFKAINREIEEYVDFMTIYNSYNVEEKDETYILRDTAFNYGVAVNEICLRKNYLKKNEKKALRLTENNDGVKTYVYYYDKNFKLNQLGILTKGNPYTITIKQICKLKEVDDLNALGKGVDAFILVSTREKNYEYTNTLIDRLAYAFTLTEKTGVLSEIAIELSDISVEPDKLEFPAEGGMQKLKVTAQGFTRFGYSIPKEYSSWLKGKTVSGGIVEITAQPNDTDKEREATIKCFVTNEENPTDDQKVSIPVTIIQKANSQPSTIKEIELYFEYEIAGITDVVPYKSGIHWYSDKSEISISGGHVTCSAYNSNLSFDIDDVNKLKSQTAKISNIKGDGITYYDDGKLADQWKISANCQTTNSMSSSDGSTYYSWSWGKGSFNGFSGSGPKWTPSSIDLSKMSDAYGSISIKLAK